MFYLKEWNKNLDLTEFYSACKQRGFENNSSEKNMLDCRKEKEWNAWILYKDDSAIGSVAAHSFEDVMGKNAFRVLARTCILEGVRSKGLMVARTAIKQHQNMVDQYLLPACLDWAGDNRVFATSNESPIASQRLVNKYYFPTLEEIGLVHNVGTVFYKKYYQTVWEINKKSFMDHLNQYPRW